MGRELAGEEGAAINRGSLALHGEHQALLLTWGTPSTGASLRPPAGCTRSPPPLLFASLRRWRGQPDPGRGDPWGHPVTAPAPMQVTAGGAGGGALVVSEKAGGELGVQDPQDGLHPSCAYIPHELWACPGPNPITKQGTRARPPVPSPAPRAPSQAPAPAAG